jgi:hypothetical protein
MACVCLGKPCRPSAMCAHDNSGTAATHPTSSTAPRSLRSEGRRNHPANGGAGYAPGIRRRCGTTRPSPGTSVGNQPHRLDALCRPSPHATISPKVSERDTHFRSFGGVVMPAGPSRVSPAAAGRRASACSPARFRRSRHQAVGLAAGSLAAPNCPPDGPFRGRRRPEKITPEREFSPTACATSTFV